MDLFSRGSRTRSAATSALWPAGLLIALAASGCGSEGATEKGRPGPTEEYRVARAIRTFVVGVYEGDGEAVCRVLTPERQAEVTAQLKQRTCEKAIAAQSLSMTERDLVRLGRSRATKVDLDGNRGRAEILTPARKGPPERHTVTVVNHGRGWKIASQFFPGELTSGTVPKAPPGPPPNPAEERKVTAVFERFRASLKRGNGQAACKLRTVAARRDAVRGAIELAGGRRQAAKEFGALTCERVSLRLQPPPDKVRKVEVDGAGARLTLRQGATYGFRRIAGHWRLDS